MLSGYRKVNTLFQCIAEDSIPGEISTDSAIKLFTTRTTSRIQCVGYMLDVKPILDANLQVLSIELSPDYHLKTRKGVNDMLLKK